MYLLYFFSAHHDSSFIYKITPVIAGGLTLDNDLQRESNPMAGSFTAYHNFALIAKQDIKAGEELLVDRTRSDYRRMAHDLPSAEDYDNADAIVKDLAEANMELTEAQWTGTAYKLGLFCCRTFFPVRLVSQNCLWPHPQQTFSIVSKPRSWPRKMLRLQAFYPARFMSLNEHKMWERLV